MRICLYVGKAPPPEQQSEWLNNARSTCDVYASNLHREFTARGHEVVFASSLAGKPKDLTPEQAAKRLERFAKLTYPEADHAICLEQNGWKFRERLFFESARAATKGMVCTICDHDGVTGPEDVLFTARRPTRRGARYVGWAADADKFYPDKDSEWLTIFIDHKYHQTGRHDHTEALLKSATTFAARMAAEGRAAGEPPRKVQVVFFSPDGLERIAPEDIRDVDLGTDRRAFYRRVPGPELAAWTRKTDIFVVSHGESMGLPVLENAMAGALVVAKRGFVKPELLNSLGHFTYDEVEDISWEGLISHLDPLTCRQRASHFVWGEVAERMLETFQQGRANVEAPPPERAGNWTILPPLPLPGHAAERLSDWRAKHVRVEAGERGERLVPEAGESKHYVRYDLRKEPWPETYTLSFQVRPDEVHGLRLWIGGELSEEKVEIDFDLVGRQTRERRSSNGWSSLDGRVVALGDRLFCQVAVRSDWAPVLRLHLLLTRDNMDVFEAGANDGGLEISDIRLGRGVSWALPTSA